MLPGESPADLVIKSLEGPISITRLRLLFLRIVGVLAGHDNRVSCLGVTEDGMAVGE